MKAFIKRDTLVNLIKERTLLTKANDIPEHFQWYNIDGNILIWDFVLQDKVMVDVEPFTASGTINPIGNLWVSVKDSLPEKNESVIAWVKDDAEIVYFDGEKFTDYIEELNHRVTHWMRKPCSPSDT